MATQQTHAFHVSGMHCNACILMTESELTDLPHVTHAKSSLTTHTVEVSGDFGDKSPAAIAEELTRTLIKRGYALSVEKPPRKKNWGEFALAAPIAAVFLLGFAALQKAGLVNLVSGGDVTYGTAFVIGIIASLSTCMAMVGGLLLAMSATFAKTGDRVRPQMLFHAGRVVSFFVLGGVIGALGSVFRMSAFATLLLGLLIGVVMLVLGLNLLDVFDWTKKLQPSTPKWIAKHAVGTTRFTHVLTPMLVGTATFFLPCGFTQSMQLYTLSTGSYVKGGLTMLAFALGTLPMLALISFSSFSVEKSTKRGVFFKAAGLIVIVFALFNVMNSLVAAGYVPPIFSL